MSRLGDLFAILLVILMLAGAIAGLGLPRMPWQESPERTKARAELEACLAQQRPRRHAGRWGHLLAGEGRAAPVRGAREG
jgi:hypothetical protein